MRVYFLSCKPAALKLNGLYVGTIDGFERSLELDPADRVLAEVVPGENLQPVNFFIDEKFFAAPPDFADVYLMEGDALIYLRVYGNKEPDIKVIMQTRFCGNLVTVFSQGSVYLSVEGAQYTLTPIYRGFADCRAEQVEIGGLPALILRGDGCAIILSESGKIIFSNRAESVSAGEKLKVRVAFETCTAAYAECEYAYDGEKLTLVFGRTEETRPPEKSIMHFAFFESVLCRGDCRKYLHADIAGRAKEISGYLGNFVGVTVPTEKFYLKHGDIPAAGLVYPKSANLYEVKYFGVTYKEDKIDNIYPVI